LVFGVLWLWSDRCESLTDSSLSQILKVPNTATALYRWIKTESLLILTWCI